MGFLMQTVYFLSYSRKGRLVQSLSHFLVKSTWQCPNDGEQIHDLGGNEDLRQEMFVCRCLYILERAWGD